MMGRAESLAAVLCIAPMLLLWGCEDTDPTSPNDAGMELSITSELAGDDMRVGDTVLVEWTCSADPSSGFNAYVSLDGGTSYTKINTEPIPSDKRKLSWVVPEVAAGRNALLKLEAVDDQGTVHAVGEPFAVPSLADITIEASLVFSDTSHYPWLYSGEILRLEWSVSSDPLYGFEVLFSGDTGSSFTSLTETALSPQTRSFSYDVADAEAARCLLKVVAKNGTKSVVAVSDTFTQNMTIRMTDNLSGKTFSHDDDLWAQWEADTAKLEQGFVVSISWNGGRDYHSVIMEEALAIDETYARVQFKTDDQGRPIDSDECYLKVHEYDNKDNNDITGPFTLKP